MKRRYHGRTTTGAARSGGSTVAVLQQRIRALAIIIVSCTVILLGTLVLTIVRSEHKQETLYKYYTSYEIQAGDTLWTIADTYSKESGIDRRAYMKELKELNHLDSDEITSGQYLTVAYYSSAPK